MTILDPHPTENASESASSPSGGPQSAGGHSVGGSRSLTAAGPDSHAANAIPEPEVGSPRGPQSADRRLKNAARPERAVGPNSRAAVAETQPDVRAPHGTGVRRLAMKLAKPILASPDDEPQTAGRQAPEDGTRGGSAAGASTRPTKRGSKSGQESSDGPVVDRQETSAKPEEGSAVDQPEPGLSARPPSNPAPLALFDPALAFAADVLGDLEEVRIGLQNRLRILTDDSEHKDGKVRGYGLDESHPDVAMIAEMVELLGELEKEATTNLTKKLKKNPLYPWIKAQRGIGDKQMARLLASIGDPYWRPEYVTNKSGEDVLVPEGPRTVSALWAYCGLHVVPADRSQDDTRVDGVGEGGGGDLDQEGVATQLIPVGVAPRRRRGMSARWSVKAKMRAYLVAKSCMKQLVKPCARDGDGPAVHVEGCQCSPYRRVYDERRWHTAGTHPDWTDAHKLNDALRVTAKAILKDLWIEAKAYHEAEKGDA